jgi:hypothetical protein
MNYLINKCIRLLVLTTSILFLGIIETRAEFINFCFEIEYRINSDLNTGFIRYRGAHEYPTDEILESYFKEGVLLNEINEQWYLTDSIEIFEYIFIPGFFNEYQGCKDYLLLEEFKIWINIDSIKLIRMKKVYKNWPGVGIANELLKRDTSWIYESKVLIGQFQDDGICKIAVYAAEKSRVSVDLFNGYKDAILNDKKDIEKTKEINAIEANARLNKVLIILYCSN